MWGEVDGVHPGGSMRVSREKGVALLLQHKLQLRAKQARQERSGRRKIPADRTTAGK